LSQFFVSPENLSYDHFRITGDEARHLIRVLRKQPNDRVVVFDGQGRRAEGVIATVEESPLAVAGRVTKNLSTTESKPIRLRLFQGLPRGTKFDYVIEKATELGADEILPFFSEKNPIELTPAQSSTKIQRWRRVAEAAAKQCSRDSLPDISPVLAFSELKTNLQGFSIMLWEKGTKPFREVLQTLTEPSKGRSSHGALNIIVGSESGFSPAEITHLIEQGVQPVSLGRRILRTETAGLAALAIVNYELEAIL